MAGTPSPTARKRQGRGHTLVVTLATTDAEVLECQRLRYSIFAEEMGATLHTTVPGLDQDSFDPYCRHLLVRDKRTGSVVGTTRLLFGEGARRAGGFYSETEFDLGRVLALSKQFMEVGRTCIHADYRSGATMATLWQGLTNVVVDEGVDFLMGCASIPIGNGAGYATAVMDFLRERYYAPEALRVFPREAIPQENEEARVQAVVPALLKAYLRVGAVICGEPHWDRDFDVADVFVLVDRERITPRYKRHFFSTE